MGVISLPECLLFEEERDLFGYVTNKVDDWEFDLNSHFVKAFVINAAQSADGNNNSSNSDSDSSGDDDKTELVKQKVTSRTDTSGPKNKKPRATPKDNPIT